jgi:hypothetical protein
MTTRTRRETAVFRRPFKMTGIDHLVPAGTYAVAMDEEMIEGLSFPAFRRVATTITVPAAPPNSAAMETITISSFDLAEAQRADGLSIGLADE